MDVGEQLSYARWAMGYYIATLRQLDYDDYLLTPHWQRKRAAKLRQSGYKCERCRYPYGLEVHHLTYEHLGCEPLSDLVTLCRRCHQREYENATIPQAAHKNR
jgi:5-methylcytosine-specific restriction endonuclease McrA